MASSDKEGEFDDSHAVSPFEIGEERAIVRAVSVTLTLISCAYICMNFFAMEFAIHSIINTRLVASGVIPAGTPVYVATAQSTRTLSNVKNVQRGLTVCVVMFWGLVSDKFGRKAMMGIACGGYMMCGVCYLIGWFQQHEVWYFLGAICLGISVPPWAAPIVDVSHGTGRLGENMTRYQGCNLLGLFIGFIVVIILSTTAPRPAWYYYAYIIGIILSAMALMNTVFFFQESLPAERRHDIKGRWHLATPLTTFYVATRNPYMFGTWFINFLGSVSGGGVEVIVTAYIALRYMIYDQIQVVMVLVIYQFLVPVGMLLLGKVYLKFLGFKRGILFTQSLTFIGGVLSGLINNTSWFLVILWTFPFFASAIIPFTQALQLGQVPQSESGLIAAVVRTSDAMGKLIGQIIIGNILMANHISPYTPDESCVPKFWSATDTVPHCRDVDSPNPGVNCHRCDCGVKKCPNPAKIAAKQYPVYDPGTCGQGQLSPITGNDNLDVPYEPIPWDIFENQGYKRTSKDGDTNIPCNNYGLFGTGKRIKLDRLWCAAESGVYGPYFGCTDLSIKNLTKTSEYLQFVGACYPPKGNSTSKVCTATCTALYNKTFTDVYIMDQLSGPKVARDLHPYMNTSDPAVQKALDIYAKESCHEYQDQFEVQVCRLGSVGKSPAFPWLIATGLIPALTLGTFILSEMCCRKHDFRGWDKSQYNLAAEQEEEQENVNDDVELTAANIDADT